MISNDAMVEIQATSGRKQWEFASDRIDEGLGLKISLSVSSPSYASPATLETQTNHEQGNHLNRPGF
ncbi:hypothetical protein [Diaphorobacter aerolatus]|uniref:Uncharacterized protein n=1 Tax=Diaphorobacter aerolatus TaxID=1288495 RepID=A0A7H0GPH4_9BURK|nr:hypothetical protein [Diaphorobacter aerolatus]QNP50190.1 hypothetical protein H9K75_10450 [Diaphorobacter aerolatus]